MSTIPQTETTLVLSELSSRSMTNPEILQLLAFYCNGDTAKPYAKHIEILEQKYDMSLEIRPIEVEVLSLTELFSVRALKNYYQASGKVGFHTTILDVIRGYQEDPASDVYVNRLEQAFGYEPDAQFIRDMLQFIDDSELDGTGSEKIYRHYRSLLDQVSDYAPIPQYVRNFGIVMEDLPRLHEHSVSEDMPSSLIAQHLIGMLDNFNLQISVGRDRDEDEEEEEGHQHEDDEEYEAYDDEERLNILTDKLSGMSVQQRSEFVRLFRVDPEEVQAIQEDPDLYRVYGPLNSYPEVDFSVLTIQQTDEYNDDIMLEEGQPDINKIFGGARMFTDMTLEYDEDNDRPMEDWFTAKCFQCSARIRAYHHAVREPLITGGWRGCFCSWKCVRDFIEVDTIPDQDHLNIFELRNSLVTLIEEEMNEVGIEDRDYEPLEEAGIDQTYLSGPNVDLIEQTRAKLPSFSLSSAPQSPVPVPGFPESSLPVSVNVQGGDINQPL